MKNHNSIFESSYSGVESEQSTLTESRHSARKVDATIFNEQPSNMTSVHGGGETELSAVNAISLSPSMSPAPSRLNHSLPAHSHCRVYSEDGTLGGSTSLRRGRPNSLKSGLPSPLHLSLIVSTAPVVSSKQVAVIDTSPILSTYSQASSSVREGREETASVGSGSLLLSTGWNVDPDAQLDDSKHNEAFTESMFADAHAADGGNVSDVISCCDVSQTSSPAVTCCSDAGLLVKPIQASITSLDSAVDVRAELEPNIPRSFSKQSIISYDSGVGLAEPHPAVYQSAQMDGNRSPSVEHRRLVREGPLAAGVRSSVCQSYSPNLQVTDDVRHLLSKAGMPLEMEVKAESRVDVKCSVGVKTATTDCESFVESCAASLSCHKGALLQSASSTVSRRQSKLVPLLPISTNLLRVSADQYSPSARRYIAGSSTVGPRLTASAAGPPRIKSALLTPSLKQCLNDADGTSQLRSVFRGKSVKRLQSSPHPNHSPVNPLSPRHVSKSRHTTVPVPFDLDV